MVEQVNSNLLRVGSIPTGPANFKRKHYTQVRFLPGTQHLKKKIDQYFDMKIIPITNTVLEWIPFVAPYQYFAHYTKNNNIVVCAIYTENCQLCIAGNRPQRRFLLRARHFSDGEAYLDIGSQTYTAYQQKYKISPFETRHDDNLIQLIEDWIRVPTIFDIGLGSFDLDEGSLRLSIMDWKFLIGCEVCEN